MQTMLAGSGGVVIEGWWTAIALTLLAIAPAMWVRRCRPQWYARVGGATAFLFFAYLLRWASKTIEVSCGPVMIDAAPLVAGLGMGVLAGAMFPLKTRGQAHAMIFMVCGALLLTLGTASEIYRGASGQGQVMPVSDNPDSSGWPQ